MMRSDLALSLVTGVCILLLVLLTHWRWRRSKAVPATPKLTRRKREPKPFAGYTHKPECEWCEQAERSSPQLPVAAPPRMIFTRGRRRHIETTAHFCPHPACSYHGRVDGGNIRANGHPSGRRWRQLVCLGCRSYFLETVGTPFHGKQVDPDKLVWAIAALAEDFLPFVKPNLSHFLPHLHDRLTTNSAGIIARTMTQHGHQDTQKSVANIA
jgi:hypothetical protein